MSYHICRSSQSSSKRSITTDHRYLQHASTASTKALIEGRHPAIRLHSAQTAVWRHWVFLRPRLTSGETPSDVTHVVTFHGFNTY